jgi:hypothetical protein
LLTSSKVTPYIGEAAILLATGVADFVEYPALEAPLLPAQLQVHGPPPLTVDAGPELQRPVVGSALAATPFAGPQEPVTRS